MSKELDGEKKELDGEKELLVAFSIVMDGMPQDMRKEVLKTVPAGQLNDVTRAYRAGKKLRPKK